MLLSYGAEFHHVDQWGNTAWHAAAASPDPEACPALCHADVEAANHAGWTAMHFAARAGLWQGFCCLTN